MAVLYPFFFLLFVIYCSRTWLALKGEIVRPGALLVEATKSGFGDDVSPECADADVGDTKRNFHIELDTLKSIRAKRSKLTSPRNLFKEGVEKNKSMKTCRLNPISLRKCANMLVRKAEANYSSK